MAEYLCSSSNIIWKSNPTSSLQFYLACYPVNPHAHTCPEVWRKINASSLSGANLHSCREMANLKISVFSYRNL